MLCYYVCCHKMMLKMFAKINRILRGPRCLAIGCKESMRSLDPRKHHKTSDNKLSIGQLQFGIGSSEVSNLAESRQTD